jgi:hypothetical protein
MSVCDFGTWASEQVPGEVDPGPLVRGALEGPLEGLHESGVLVADDQPHPGQSALLERGQEATPERLVLTVPDIEPQHLS